MQPSSLVVTASEMRAIEADSVRNGATWHGLMETAGAEVADFVLGGPGVKTGGRAVVVLVGPGNNGGDGLVVARHLARAGWRVRCLSWQRNETRPDLVEELAKHGIRVEPISENVSREDVTSLLRGTDLVVDGLFGTGLIRNVAGRLCEIMGAVARTGARVVAIDIPSGIDSDTGQVKGCALRADATVALGHLKFGHVQPPGSLLCGLIETREIGLDEKSSVEHAGAEMITAASVTRSLPARPDDANKGTFGKAMVVAGSVNYVGAAALAVHGAMRTGAGLVTLACAGDLLGILAAKLTECTFLPLPADLGVVAGHAAEKLRSNLDGYTSLLMGSGLGKEKETANFLREFFGAGDAPKRAAGPRIGFAARLAEETGAAAGQGDTLPPIVLDGDALNILAEWEGWQQHVPTGSVLTPHPGEMARLTASTVEAVQADRPGTARRAAQEWSQVVVLKGAGTIVAEPGGRLYVSPYSNAALATAGSGDVLAGAIAGFIAQGVSPIYAACAGVYLHGAAGALLRDEYGPAGGLAGDLPVLLAKAQRSLREASSG